MRSISKKILSTTFLVLLLGLVFFTSCKKNETSTDQDVNVNQSNEDNATTESNFDNTQTISDDVASQFGTSFTRTEEAYQVTDTYMGCATATFTKNPAGSTNLYTIVIDFGTGCKDPNTGITRTGKVIINMTARPVLPNSVTTITFDNHTVNGVKVEGTHKTTNISTVSNATVTPKQQIDVTGAKLTFTDGTTSTWQSSRTRTWTQGFSTRDILDDVFEINGTYSGTNRNGTSYSALIKTGLILKVACWKQGFFKPASGVLQVVTNNATATIDYGNGDCNNTFTVTVNGKTYTVQKKS